MGFNAGRQVVYSDTEGVYFVHEKGVSESMMDQAEAVAVLYQTVLNHSALNTCLLLSPYSLLGC